MFWLDKSFIIFYTISEGVCKSDEIKCNKSQIYAKYKGISFGYCSFSSGAAKTAFSPPCGFGKFFHLVENRLRDMENTDLSNTISGSYFDHALSRIFWHMCWFVVKFHCFDCLMHWDKTWTNRYLHWYFGPLASSFFCALHGRIGGQFLFPTMGSLAERIYDA